VGRGEDAPHRINQGHHEKQDEQEPEKIMFQYNLFFWRGDIFVVIDITFVEAKIYILENSSLGNGANDT
jgi:hypothetical protein